MLRTLSEKSQQNFLRLHLATPWSRIAKLLSQKSVLKWIQPQSKVNRCRIKITKREKGKVKKKLTNPKSLKT